MSGEFKDLKIECLEANLALPKLGLVNLTFGNVSVYDPEQEVFAIKPSGVGYDKLTLADMVVLDMTGTVVSGNRRPSSDTPTHRALYMAFGGKGVRAIVHTHSQNATMFAQAGRSIPCLGTTHADYFLGEVPVTRAMTSAEIEGGAYEWDTGQVIVERLGSQNPLEAPAILVRNHAPFVWASTPDLALETSVALELVAEMAWKTLILMNLPALPKDSSDPTVTREISNELLNKHFFRKHGPGAYYGQPAAASETGRA